MPSLSTQEMTLHYDPHCQECERVLSYLDDQGISIPRRNIRKDIQARHALVCRGGSAKVPSLVVNDEVVYSADSIIKWFEQERE